MNDFFLHFKLFSPILKIFRNIWSYWHFIDFWVFQSNFWFQNLKNFNLIFTSFASFFWHFEQFSKISALFQAIFSILSIFSNFFIFQHFFYSINNFKTFICSFKNFIVFFEQKLEVTLTIFLAFQTFFTTLFTYFYNISPNFIKINQFLSKTIFLTFEISLISSNFTNFSRIL